VSRKVWWIVLSSSSLPLLCTNSRGLDEENVSKVKFADIQHSLGAQTTLLLAWRSSPTNDFTGYT
jgi:hypothetical protein